MLEKLKKIRIDVISLLLIVICSYIFGIMGLGISALLLVVYYFNSKSHYFIQKLIIFLWLIGIIFVFGGLLLINGMENTGIDSIGEALVYGAMINIGRIMTMIFPIILLVIDNRKFIFTKKILTIIAIILIGILSYFPIRNLITTTKIRGDIPSVIDFENELNKRGFEPDEADYRLYGINSKNKKAISLSFENNGNDKYPLYVYSVIDYPWLIYYANGEIYAAKGKYWDYYTAYGKKSGYNEEKILWDYSGDVISETEEIFVYDIKLNRYKKGNTITSDDFNYYSNNKNTENSVFIDIPSIESWGSKIKQIDRVDYDSLDRLK